MRSVRRLLPLGSSSSRTPVYDISYTARPPQRRTTYKILLLGTGESGKRTLSIQVRNNFTDNGLTNETYTYTETIRTNILSMIVTVCKACLKMGIFVPVEDHAMFAKYAAKTPNNGHVVEEPVVREEIRFLFNNGAFLETLDRADEYQMHWDAHYILRNWERMCATGYIPTVDDVLHSRLRTTGIVEDSVEFSDVIFKWVLTGGQRSERRKWIHTFEGVHVVVFVVSLAEYNLTLAEHDAVNRMQESLQVFEELCKCRWFSDVPLVLIFNKYDLFFEKIQRVDLSVCFPEYTGGCHHDKAFNFIINKFKNTAGRKIEIQVMAAIDTESTNITLAEIMRSCMQAYTEPRDAINNFEILPQAIVNHVLQAGRT